MIKPVPVAVCVFASYFFMFWMLMGHWRQALMTAVLATLVFSTTLLATSLVLRDRPWLAFWIANIVLILVFGGVELHGLLTIKDNPATRFGGYRLSGDGHITAAGFESLALDIAICTASNLIGFFAAHVLIERLKIKPV